MYRIVFFRYLCYNITLNVHAFPYWFDDNFVEKDFVLYFAPANNKFAIFRDSAFIFSSWCAFATQVLIQVQP